jgi:predicted GH43/DUF377 family glycosyl hydrolase
MNKFQKIKKLLQFKYRFWTNKPNRLKYTAPIFDWDVNKDIEIDDPCLKNILAENMVYYQGKFFLAFSNYLNDSIGLLETETPEGLWHYRAKIVCDGSAPHIIERNGTWYCFYHDNIKNICLRISQNLTYGYSDPVVVLSPDSDWERARVHEPFVHQVGGMWVMLYMGDSGNFTEQIGLAWSRDLIEWRKDSKNPVLKFGKTYDRGTVADPWVFYEAGIYYIGYACSPYASKPWRTALAITSVFDDFRKLGVILNLGHGSSCAFRGALTRIGDTLYFPYTSRSKGKYKISIAIKYLKT